MTPLEVIRGKIYLPEFRAFMFGLFPTEETIDQKFSWSNEFCLYKYPSFSTPTCPEI